MSWFLVLVVVVMSVKYACINEVCVGKAEKERERERIIFLWLWSSEKDKRCGRTREKRETTTKRKEDVRS